MTINEWFDVNNPSHVQAYEYMQIHGCWPEGFLPYEIEFEQGWVSILHTQFVDAWMEHIKTSNI